MSIKPIIPNNTYNSRHFIKGMASRGLAPLILLEACVEFGRTYQAAKRGGFDEGRERITEELTGAIFWFSGVKGCNKLIDYTVGNKLLKLPETNFDVGKDSLHNPLKNYIKKYGISEKKIANFKFAKVASSIIIANCLVGFLVPKLNQSITKYYRKNRKTSEQSPTNTNTNTFNPQKVSIAEFLNKTNDKKAPTTFTGLINTQTLLSLANHFENDAKYQLLSTDVGIASGRTIMARNNDERREILIRDLSSIYFYMFNMPNMNKWLNKLEDGYKTRLDPVSAKYATDEFKQLLKENNGQMSIENFRKHVLDSGKYQNPITESMNTKFAENDKNIITLDDFLSELQKTYKGEEYAKLSKIASDMADLQPAIEDIKILSKSQVESIFKGGYINDPQFLDNLFEIATKEDIPFKKNLKSDRKNPLKFVSQAELEGIRQDAINYVEDIIKRAKNGIITEDTLNKACRANFIKNSLNWGTGFVISAAFLSTFIPKIQYWVTQKLTGQNKFPGTRDLDSQNKINTKA